MTVLLNAAGIPEPSPEVQRRLRAVHPNLFLRFIPHLAEQGAVCWAWPESDARWEQVRTGECDPARAHDIVGYLPMGCSQDEAPAHLERTLRSFPKEEVRRLADRMQAFNSTEALQAQVQEALKEVMSHADPTGRTKVRRGKKVDVTPVV